MKKQKTVKPFYFKEASHEEVSNLIDNELPINLKYNEDLINRIHQRYPIISKSEIAFIVKTIFQSFRELLILGDIINFHNVFFNTKLYFYSRKKNGYIIPNIRVKITTPPNIKRLKND
jgi:hypothetical protein